MEKVGIVGLGAMGSALLERLKLAGVPTTVYDCHSPTLESCRSAGVEIAPSAAALARAVTIIDLVVRTDQDILDCAMGKEGLLDGARPGTLVLLHSTILPQTTQKVAEAARRRDVYVIDACMAAVPDAVRAGDLIFLVGGPKELVDRARPHLLQMGKEVLHIGPLGAGNVFKLLKNLLTGAEKLIIHEAIRITEATGIPFPTWLEIMRPIHVPVLNRWQTTFDPSGVNPNPRTGITFEKDLALAAELGRCHGLNLPIIEQLVASGKQLMSVGASD